MWRLASLQYYEPSLTRLDVSVASPVLDDRVSPAEVCWLEVQVAAMDGSLVATFKPHWSKMPLHQRLVFVRPAVCGRLVVHGSSTTACRRALYGRVVPYCILNECSMDRLLVRQTGIGPAAAETASCWGGANSRFVARAVLPAHCSTWRRHVLLPIPPPPFGCVPHVCRAGSCPSRSTSRLRMRSR